MNLLILVNANSKSGFGHFFRILRLIKKLIILKCNICLIVNINSDLTITKGVCSAGNRLPQGWYIFWGKEGPGYDGYQVAYLSGSDCGATTLVLNDC